MEPHFIFCFSLGLPASLNLRNDMSTARKFIWLSAAVTKIMMWQAFFFKFHFSREMKNILQAKGAVDMEP
jgi:hypothetical protein